MSQAGDIDAVGSNPEILTTIITDDGSAVAIANTIELLTALVPAGTIPLETVASGNTVTINVQYSQAIAATDATRVGLAAFDSANFAVDANGFVTFIGGGGFVTSVSGTANRITSTGGTTPVIDIAATYVGQASITTLGTVATGTWQATAVGAIYGGTAQSTYTTGDILYASAANTLSKLPIGSNGKVLTVTAGIPAWETNAGGDVVGPASATDHAIVRFDLTTGKLIQNSVAVMGDNGDILISGTNNGGDNFVRLDNVNNTAGSGAYFSAEVAGSTAGDAFFQAQVAAGQAWTWGLDNSDSDAYALAASGVLGTTNVMRASVAGEINYPLQPAFNAYLGTSDSNVTGDGTSFTIGTGNAMTEVFDQNSDFNTNGTFTAPVTGRYLLTACVLAQQVTAAMTSAFAISTSNRVYTFGNWASSVNGNMPLNCTVLADMDAADTATIIVNCGGGAKVVDIYGSADSRTYFHGKLSA